MEYFAGYPLEAWIKAGGINLAPLSFREKLGIALQISEGIAYLHTNGVLHRDIKPANVLVSDNLKAKVADFGLVKPIEGTAFFAGTPAYLSPECFRGKPATFQSDVYALGITLIELFTSEPFSERHRRIPLESLLGSEHPDFPYSLAPALRKSIEEAPERRFGSAGEFRDAIQCCLDEVTDGWQLSAKTGRLRKGIFLAALRLRRSKLAQAYQSIGTLAKDTAICLLFALCESAWAWAALRLVTNHISLGFRLFALVLLPSCVFWCGMVAYLTSRKPLEILKINRAGIPLQPIAKQHRGRWSTIAETLTIAIAVIWLLLWIRLALSMNFPFSDLTFLLFELVLLGFSFFIPFGLVQMVRSNKIFSPVLLISRSRNPGTGALVIPRTRNRLDADTLIQERKLGWALHIYIAFGVAGLSTLVMSLLLLAIPWPPGQILGLIVFFLAGFVWLPQEKFAEAIAGARNATPGTLPEHASQACRVFDVTEPFNRIARNLLVSISCSVLLLILVASGLVACGFAYNFYRQGDVRWSLFFVALMVWLFLYCLIPYRLLRERLRRTSTTTLSY